MQWETYVTPTNALVYNFCSISFHIAPMCFGIIISPSWGSWHQYFFNAYSNKVGYCWYHNVCMLIVTYFVTVCFEEILVPASWRWQENNETCRSYVKDSMHKLWNSAFVSVTWFFTSLVVFKDWVQMRHFNPVHPVFIYGSCFCISYTCPCLPHGHMGSSIKVI